MHGRLKIKTTAEQEAAKKIEQEKKLKLYKVGIEKIFAKRAEKEYDEEALALTSEFLQRNPDLYTLWNFRKEILLSLKEQKTEEELQALGSYELELTKNCLHKNPKSYGAWHHRFWSLEFMPNPDWNKELLLCNAFLSMDERNFHCWDYRRQVCGKCHIDPNEEFAFTTNLIEKNFSNYSAWHYRSKLMPIVHPGSTYIAVDEETLLREYEMVQNAAFTDPDDQSAWFYHRWLLGRGNEKLQILSISVVPKMEAVVVLMSSPVKVKAGCSFFLKINGKEETEAEWCPVGGVSNVSTLWYNKISPSKLKMDEISEFSLRAVRGNEECFLNCTIDGSHSSKNSTVNNTNIFCSDISAATKDVLEKELQCCKELCDLEPDNKWAVFTSVLLMKALSSQNYYPEICKQLEQLKTVDGMRKNYYHDLGNKFFIENVIENLPMDSRKLCLCNRNLRTLHHFDHFHLMTKVDLSGNDIMCFDPLCFLLSVEILILDGNRMTSCNNIRNLKCLKHLSLKTNNIATVHELESLVTCPELRKLFLSCNPVTEVPRYESKIKGLLGKIILDGIHLQ